MATIKDIEGMSDQEVLAEVQRGGRFVVFQWCVSVIAMTFKRSSRIHFIRAGEKTTRLSLPYTLLTLAAGWWGIPWGPIYSIQSLFRNFSGGIDVTDEVVCAPATAAE